MRQLEEHLNQSTNGFRHASDSRDEHIGESSYVGHDVDESTSTAAPFLLNDQPEAQLKEINDGKLSRYFDRARDPY